MKAITIIQDEHRAITAVVEGLRHLVAEVGAGRMAADHQLFGAMFHYIEAFPQKPHLLGVEKSGDGEQHESSTGTCR